MQIKPTKNRILVELDESPRRFAGGELEIARVPDREGAYKMFPKRGTVLAIGPSVQDLKVGDRIIATKYHGIELSRQTSEKRMMIVREDHVVLKIEGDADVWPDRELIEYIGRKRGQ